LCHQSEGFGQAEQRGDRNLVKFIKEKCKALYLRRNNPRHKYALQADSLESRSAEQEVGILLGQQVDHQPAT